MGVVVSLLKLSENGNRYIKISDTNGVIYESYNQFPEWTNKFVKNKIEDTIDYEKFYKTFGFDLMNCKIVSQYKENGRFYWKLKHDDKTDIIDINDIPHKKIERKVLPYFEIGCQQKGLNAEFYDDCDHGKVLPYIFTKEDAIDFFAKYVDESHRIYFRSKILDKFVDNECIMCIL